MRTIFPQKTALLLSKLVVHAADLSNPILPSWKVVCQWADRVTQEFTHQVEKEKEAGLPFAPHMDGLTNWVAISKLQVCVQLVYV